MTEEAQIREVLERVDRYLASLPRGLSSHPDCVSKASNLTFQLVHRPAPALRQLPEPVRRVLEDPPLPSTWIPTTVFVAATLAIEAHHGITDETLAIESTEEMLKSKLYGLSLKMLTPSMILRAGAATWGLFHRGSRLVSHKNGDVLEARMSFPSGLFPLEMLRGYAAGFQCVTRASWKKDARVRLVDSGPTFGLFRLD